MKTKFFTRSGSMFYNQIDVASLEQEMNTWLAAHPQIKIIETQHTMESGTWNNAQLVITLYYEEPTP